VLDKREKQHWWVQVVWGSEGVPLPSVPEGIRILTLEEVERLGMREPRPHQPPRPGGVATISYTSGTTGIPKGMLGCWHLVSWDSVLEFFHWNGKRLFGLLLFFNFTFARWNHCLSKLCGESV
jgi:acyl-coenzyme A synthetase/AMP-(fatty) acid ligase